MEAVGSGVHTLKVGQRVFVTGRNSGSYAEYIVSESAYVFPLHERLSFAQGAALGVPYFTAYKALIMGANAKPGEVVLVHGASGAVGNAAVQIARAIGTTVVGTAGTKDGRNEKRIKYCVFICRELMRALVLWSRHGCGDKVRSSSCVQSQSQTLREEDG